MRIAICDDELPMHDLLKKQLNRYAQKRNLVMSYTDFTGGNELLINPYDYDLIFMDYQMKVLDGLETAKKLRKLGIETPVIFLTSFPHIVFDTFSVHAYRFLVKPTQSARAMMPDADMELPYEGAKEMLLVDNVDSKDFLTQLLTAMYDELPPPKPKKR
jgi:DNA-binding LytR/AlgR family response regulator